MVANANSRTVFKGKEQGLVVTAPPSSLTGAPAGRNSSAEIDAVMKRIGGTTQEQGA